MHQDGVTYKPVPKSDVLQSFIERHISFDHKKTCCNSPSNTRYYCRYCFDTCCDRCFEGICKTCSDKINYVNRFTDLRGKKIDPHPECYKSNQTWPPIFITNAWTLILKAPSDSLLNMGYMYMDVPASLILSLYLQYHYNQKLYTFTDDKRRHCFDLNLWITSFDTHTNTKLTDMLDSLKSFQLFPDVDTPYSGCLIVTKEVYRDCLWTTMFVKSMFSNNAFDNILKNFISVINCETDSILDSESPLFSRNTASPLDNTVKPFRVVEEIPGGADPVEVDQQSSLPGLSEIPSHIPSGLFGSLDVDMDTEQQQQQRPVTLWDLMNMLIFQRSHCFTNTEYQSIINELLRLNVLTEHNMNITLFKNIIKVIAKAENISCDNFEEAVNILSIIHITNI